jgi:hypothetical protein
MIEVHLTFNLPLTELKDICEGVNAKPIEIQFEQAPSQVMTTSLVKTYQEYMLLKEEMELRYGQPVERAKLEVQYKGEDARSIYYEAHFEVDDTLEQSDLPKWLHKSKNRFKGHTRMYTVRSNDNMEFLARCKETELTLKGIKRIIKETCILDSNESIDNGWFSVG